MESGFNVFQMRLSAFSFPIVFDIYRGPQANLDHRTYCTRLEDFLTIMNQCGGLKM